MVHDLRSFIRLLQERGELVRISREVDPKFEMPAVMGALEQQRKAFMFENVRGAKFPVVGGLLNKLERFGLALGYAGKQAFTDLEFDQLLENAKANALAPVTVAKAPSQSVVLSGAEINLHELPVPTFFELDTGPFITAAIGTTRDPETGIQNVGVYRTLIIDRDRCIINASSMSDLRRHYAAWEKRSEPMPIAIALGVDPAMLTAAACKLPPNHCEYEMGGALQGKPMELVQCLSSDLLVPAQAEIIIEGHVDFSQRVENLLGEFAGQYGPETAPATQVMHITHRPEAMFYSIMAGRNPEHNTLGSVAVYGVQRSIAEALTEAVPDGIKDVHVYLQPGLGTLAHVVVAIDKRSDDQPREIIEKAFAGGGHIFPMSKITKRVIVVDDDIDVRNWDDVEWAIWNRAATHHKHLVIPEVESWELERAAKAGQKSVRLGVDATMDLEDVDKLVRPITPGAKDINLSDYIDNSRTSAA